MQGIHSTVAGGRRLARRLTAGLRGAGRRLALTAVLGLLGGLAGPGAVATAPAQAASLVPSGWAGINAQFLFSAPQSVWDVNFKNMAADGIQTVRSDSSWNLEEPNPPVNGVHTYNWTKLDQWVGGLSRRGLTWAAIVDFSVAWDSTNPASGIAPPAEYVDYAAYAGALVSRYGPNGTFWRSNWWLPYRPVHTWEIWNEENLNLFWAPAPDPAAYADMYAAAQKAIHAADPRAVAMMGGVTPDNLEGMLGIMLTKRPDVAHNLDAVGYHPYAPDAATSIAQIKRLRQDLAAMGDSATPIYITEVGWHTQGGYGSVTDQTRAGYYQTLTTQVARGNCNVAGFLPHTWFTNESDPNNPEDWFGIRHIDNAPSQTELTYSQVLLALEGKASQAGVSSTYQIC